MRKSLFFVIFCFLSLFISERSQADVFNTTRFVLPGQFAIGLESEISFSDGAGLSGNLRYTHGLTDLSNAYLTLGSGNGTKRFRVGSGVVFDFFPDVDGQPGIGVSAHGTYYRLESGGRLELKVTPYLHKTFLVGDNELDPFLAFPLGIGFGTGGYQTVINVAVGTLFEHSQHFSFVLELGVAIQNTSTYFSGGIIYYY